MRRWMMPLTACVAICMALAAARADEPKAYKDEPGPYTFTMLDETWATTGEAGEAEEKLTVRVWLPSAKADEKLPVIIFSHGAGGDQKAYTYFGRRMASWGYIVVHPRHADAGILTEPAQRPMARRGMEAIATTADPAQLIQRPRDVAFAIDRIAGHERLGPVADLTRVAAAGHSFGAYTSMCAGGMRVNPDGKGERSLGDPRVKAVIAMSAQGPGLMGISAKSWDAMALPVLMLTGSRDMGQGRMAVNWRHEPFVSLPGPDAYFASIKDAGHMTFALSGPYGDASDVTSILKGRPGAQAYDPRHTAWILQLCTAFLDAHLRSDADALRWLQSGAIKGVSTELVTFEAKSAPAAVSPAAPR